MSLYYGNKHSDFIPRFLAMAMPIWLNENARFLYISVVTSIPFAVKTRVHVRGRNREEPFGTYIRIVLVSGRFRLSDSCFLPR